VPSKLAAGLLFHFITSYLRLVAEGDRIRNRCRTEFSFQYVSVASSGGEYSEVTSTDSENSDDAYFLIQQQFESYDRGYFYVESHERPLCGQFRVRRAELGGTSFASKWGANRPRRAKSDSRSMVPSTANLGVC
jgi:hypothetical protein